MSDAPDGYAVHYRWEWFRREQWQRSFRERKRHSSGAFIELVRQRGLAQEPVLDCSCGLGLKTIVMREAGLNVQGSDRCESAVGFARLLAREEGLSDLPYFVSAWSDLPRQTATRYAAIFNDALSWVHSEDEMASSLTGLCASLQPGGILAYMGALPGSDTDQTEFVEQEWRNRTANGRHVPGLFANLGGTSVQEAVFLERGTDFIDEHHLYIVNEDGARRMETWRLRCSLKWSWPRILPLLENAGFVSFTTQEFIAANGKPFHLVVAARK